VLVLNLQVTLDLRTALVGSYTLHTLYSTGRMIVCSQ